MEQHYGIVIVGGGSAGCAAAVAAARHGKRVLLIERYGFLGGTGTSVLDSFYGFFLPGLESKRVVGGVGWEVVKTLDALHAMMFRPSSYGAGTAVTYNPEVLKIVWDQMVIESGAEVLFHALCTRVRCDGQRWHVTVATRTEPRDISAHVLIDATGDAQVSAWAGAKWDPIDPTHLQSLTTIFRLVNVDSQLAETITHDRLVELMNQAVDAGYDLPRIDGSIHKTPITGSYVANMTRVTGVNPLIPERLSQAEIEGRRQVLLYVKFLKDFVPGYRDAALAGLSIHVGVRESRRIIGQYTLTREDVLRAREFPDTIALSGAPIEDHQKGSNTTWEYLPPGLAVGIPLRTLIPEGMTNLLVAGRCLSATHDAHAAIRSMGQCMAMGQAAGTTAALAIEADVSVAKLPYEPLRDALLRNKAILEVS